LAEYNAGEGRLRIVPDASDFKKRLDAQLAKIRAEFAIPVHPTNLAQAAADIERWRRQQEQDDVNIPVDVDSSQIAQATREVKRLSAAGTDAGKVMGALKVNIAAIGIANLPAVATALTGIAGALEQVTQAGLLLPGVIASAGSSIGTLKLGMSGVSDAYKAVQKSADGSQASIQAANDAMADLAPNARDVVTTLTQLTPKFDELKDTVQDNLFAGLSSELKTLADKDFPTFEKGLGGIGTAWNKNIVQLLHSLSSDSSIGLFDRIFGNTTDAQTRLTQAIDPLVHAFGTLAAAGTDTFPRLSDGAGRLADRFNTFITAADQDGRLDKWIDSGIKGFEHIGSILLDLGKSFTGITKAAGGGEGLLGILDKGAESLATFLNSAEGQDKLKRFFDDGKQQLAQWLPILQSLPGLFTGIYNAARQWTDQFLPPLAQISSFLGEHPGLIEAVGEMFLAWKAVDGVTNLLGALGKVSTSLRTGMPAAAADGAAGVNKALALIVVPEIAKQLNDQIQQYLKDNFPDLYRLNNTNTPDQLGVKARQWVDEHLFGPAATPNQAPGQGTLQGGIPQAQLQAPAGTRESGGLPTPKNSTGLPDDQAHAPASSRDSGGLPPGIVVPSRAKGGPTPSGRGPGPTGGWLAEIHSDEWVLPAHARATLGDQALWAMTRGRSFAPGGYIDEHGNPITPGTAPGGPASVAPAPDSGGIMPALASLTSGLQGPIGNVLNLATNLAGVAGDGRGSGVIPGLQSQHGAGTVVPAGYTPSSVPLSLADRAAGMPGLWGLVGSAFGSDPGANVMNWGEQTGQWLGNFTARTVGSFATTLLQGALGLVGLDNSIFSPNNSWNRSGQGVGQFAFSADGPLGRLLGANTGAGAAGSGRSKGPSEKQLRDAAQKIDRADQKVAEIKQRIAELPAKATASRRQSLDHQLLNAAQEAADARADFSSLQTTGGGAGASRTVLSGASAVGARPPAGSGVERWRPAVRAALATYGPRFGITNMAAWEDAMVRQLQTESGGNPAADNPTDSNGRGGTQHVSGIAQFLPSTFAANNITGGAYLDPYAQIAAMIPYVANKYGMDASGAPKQIGRGVGYAHGGAARGPGGPKGDKIPALLSDNEHVFTSADVEAMGGQAEVYAFRHALHRASGGEIALAALRNPTPPRVPDIARLNPRPAQSIAPTPTAPPTPPASVAPTNPRPPDPAPTRPPQRQLGVAPVAPAPAAGSADPYSHNLAAISTGISSGASTLGNLASTAMSVAGGGGGVGIPGMGAAGSYVAGLIGQGGKIVDNVVNVGSSFLVGRVPGSFGTTDNAYGQTLRPAQNVPVTAPDNRRSYVFNGIDGRRIVDDLRLMDAQDSQAALAQWANA